MSKVVINELTLTNIGAAIREKTGKTDLIAPGDMPAEIRAIETGGGGGGTEIEDGLIQKTLAGDYKNSRVTSIGEYGFRGCTNLTGVEFPNVTSVGSYAFHSCTGLTSVAFPNLTSLANGTFGKCTNLTGVEFPNVTSIGTYVFQETGLTSANFPNVTSIGTYSFNKCKQLTSVTMPNVTTLGTYCFESCEKLTSIDFPNVTTIPERAFYGCESLVSVNLPAATSINSFAFCLTSDLTRVEFPKVTSIQVNAFQNSNVAHIDFPCLARVPSKCFYKCTKLTALILRNSTMATLGATDALTSTPIASGTGYIYVPSALIDSYKTATNWSTYAAQFRAIEDYPDICG